MIYGIWYMVYDIWYMIYDIWYMVYDIWYMIIYKNKGVGEPLDELDEDGKGMRSRQVHWVVQSGY